MLIWIALTATAANLEVRQSCDAYSTDCYTSFDNAVAAAGDGDEIRVYRTEMTTAGIVIDKRLSIVGMVDEVGARPRLYGNSAAQQLITVLGADLPGDRFDVTLESLAIRPGAARLGLQAIGEVDISGVDLVFEPAGTEPLFPEGGAVYATLGPALIFEDSGFSGFRRTADAPAEAGMGGAAIFVDEGDLQVIRSTFDNNLAFKGGAIEVLDGTLAVVDSTFTGNVATALDTAGGGAIFTYGADVEVRGSTFNNNRAPNNDGGDLYVVGGFDEGTNGIVPVSLTIGPGVSSTDAMAGHHGGSTFARDATVFVDGYSVTGARAGLADELTGSDLGGALAVISHDGFEIASMTTSNTTAPLGGAIGIRGTYGPTATLAGLTLSLGEADRGGLVYVRDTAATVSSSTFGSSKARTFGGCLAVQGAQATLEDVAFTGCEAGVFAVGQAPPTLVGGGALYSEGTVLLAARATFADNSAGTPDVGEIGFGGHLLARNTLTGPAGSLELSDSTITGGLAHTAGAIGAWSVPVEITDVAFRDVTATRAGAIGIVNATSTTVRRSSFCNVGPSSNGAVAIGIGELLGFGDSPSNTPVLIENSVFRALDNRSAEGPGALWSYRSDVHVRHTTFVGTTGSPVLAEMRPLEPTEQPDLQFDRNLVLGSDAGPLFDVDPTRYSGSGNYWWPDPPPTDFLDATDRYGGNALTDLGAATDPCAEPWVWPDPAGDLPDRTAGAGDGADLDGTAPDPGASGGPQADPTLWGDPDGDGSPTIWDCDSEDSSVFPGAPELCDGVDNDCDGLVDAADTEIAEKVYVDADGDGFGDNATATYACPSEGTVSKGGDCDDTTADVSPASAEICDGLDNDCDGDKDEGVQVLRFLDADGDGHVSELPTEGLCPDDGQAEPGPDCDDTSPDIHPESPDVCDGLDNDCDDTIDEDCDEPGDPEDSGLPGDTASDAPDQVVTVTGGCQSAGGTPTFAWLLLLLAVRRRGR